MHILVYGSSLIAKSLVLGLLQNNIHEITWVCPEYTPAKRWVALSNTSIKFLQDLNLWQNLNLQSRQIVNSMQIGSKNNFLDLKLSAYKNYLNQLAYILHTHDIDVVLDTALNFICGFKKIYSEIQSIKLNTIQLSNQNNIQADAIILTQDYVNSQAELNYNNAIEYNYTHKAITTVLQADIPHNGNAYQWFIDRDIIALLPLPNNQFALVWSTHNIENKIENILDSLYKIQPDIIKLKISSCIDEVKVNSLKLKLNPNIKQNNVILLGDMVHKIHPLAGQGLNLGFRDVVELLKTLNNSTFIQLDNNLAKYACQRISDIYSIATITHSLYRINNNQILKNILPLAFKFADKIPIIQKLMLKTAK